MEQIAKDEANKNQKKVVFFFYLVLTFYMLTCQYQITTKVSFDVRLHYKHSDKINNFKKEYMRVNDCDCECVLKR